MYLFDTNACLDFTLGRSALLRQRVDERFDDGIAISAITLAELRVGAKHVGATPEDSLLLDGFVRLIDVHPFDHQAAEQYGRVAREVGVKRRTFDRLIAAHGLALGLIVVTNNIADFADVPGLIVENWTQ